MQSVGCGTEIDATQVTQLDSNYLNIRTINNSVQQLYTTTLLRIIYLNVHNVVVDHALIVYLFTFYDCFRDD